MQYGHGSRSSCRSRPTPSIVEYTSTPNSAPHCWCRADGSFGCGDRCHKLGKFDPKTGRFVEWPMPTEGSRPHASPGLRTAGCISRSRAQQDRGLRPETERFTEYPVPSPRAGRTHRSRPDGAIWFTEQSGNRIGRSTRRPARSPSIPSRPRRERVRIIASRPENAVYFAELEGTSSAGWTEDRRSRVPTRRRPRVSDGSRSTGAAHLDDLLRRKVARFDPATRRQGVRRAGGPGAVPTRSWSTRRPRVVNRSTAS